MTDRNSAGKDIDPGIVNQASQGRSIIDRMAASLGYQRATPARGPESVPSKEEASAKQPQDIPGIQSAWMSPLNPLHPSAPASVRGRALDYMVGWNVTTNNSRLGQPTASELRALARTCDLVAMAIQTRKDQLEQGTFDFKLKGDRTGFKSVKDARIEELRAFFAFPDKRRPFSRWIRKWVDDLLILDSPCIWTQKTRGGKPYLMRVIDAATIKPLIDEDGEIPLPPAPAFQQWLKGVPAADYSSTAADGSFTSDDLLWHPRNPRPDTIFGYSPVEQIYVTVNLAIRRQLLILSGYTAGTVPEALIPVPEDWKMEDITNFQVYWEAILQGNDANRRGVRFVPNGLDKAVFTKPWQDHTDFDEWLARVVMFAFGLPPTAFVKQMNRATAEQAAASADDEGKLPYLTFVCEVINILIWKHFGYTDIEAVFRESNTSTALQDAQAAEVRIRSGQTSVDEERADQGREGVGQGPVFLTAAGPIPVGENALDAVAQAQVELSRGAKPADETKAGDKNEKKDATEGDEKKAEQLAEKVAGLVMEKLEARKKKLY